MEVVFELESSVSRFFSQPLIKISSEMFSILHKADGRLRLSDPTAQLGFLGADRLKALTQELIELWSRRAVILSPI